MTNQKSTKRALLTSVLALLVCVTMLIGSTFAWFTDSAISGRNKINSGNLDIVLELGTLKADAQKATTGVFAGYYDADDYDWTEVTSTTEIFSDEDLFEPGYMKTAVFRVRNAGTLALKYQLAANVYKETEGTNVYGDKFKLSDVLDVAFVKGAVDLGSRATAWVYVDAGASVGAVTGKIADTVVDGTFNAKDEMMYYTMLIGMKETVGNEANYMTGTAVPTIEFGIELIATQRSYEEDSFGKDYDANATYPELPEAEATDLGAITVPDADGKFTLADGSEMTIINNTFSSHSKANPASLDQAYVLSALETPEEAEKSPYRYWHADFVVTFDKDLISTDGTGVVGNYGEWGWIGFDAADFGVLTADTEYRLFASEGIYMNYYELCKYVKNFICGAFDDGTNAGTGMTVEIRLYETEDYITGNNSHNVETGAYKTAATIDYVF